MLCKVSRSPNHLQASEVFPPMVYHMTGIGEETGNMEEMLAKLADYYDEEVEITTQSVLAANGTADHRI